MAEQPPAEIDAGPVVLRRWREADVEALEEAVVASIDHLRPWMPWAAEEPISRQARRRIIRGWDERWDEGAEFVFGIVHDDRVVGGCGAHRRIGPGGVEIGYWLRPDAEGHGFARAAAGALTRAVLGLDRTTHVEIHHDVANERSGRIPAALGFRHVEDHDDEVQAPGEAGVERVWRLERGSSVG